MSGYEKNQNQESNGNNKESENDMETNQMQSEGKTGSTPPEFRGAYVEGKTFMKPKTEIPRLATPAKNKQVAVRGNIPKKRAQMQKLDGGE
ncbi:hypothetical protein JTB14_003116 [Gonioctena quinquepunctata]|nr:hypothetical protein JTB14_003116 [Gonioctena quinquepunctata]